MDSCSRLRIDKGNAAIMPPAIPFCIRIACLLAVVLMAAPWRGAVAREPALASLETVLDELRQGGFVIYLRHAVTDTATANPGEDLARCPTQRNLSAKGRDDAVQIGASIRALGIPVGVVTASPYCRTRDTARLAFGAYVEDRNLEFAIGTDAVTTQRQAAALRQLLASPPAPGSNSFLVSHSANLFEAAGIFAKPEGAAYVFRPLAQGRFEAVARILPADWKAAARRHAAGVNPASSLTR